MIADLWNCEVLKESKKESNWVLENLEIQAKEAEALLLWLDCDREGEAIAFDVIDHCERSSGQIKEIYRAKFSALTSVDVIKAIENLERPNPLLADAVTARIELDLRAGASFTQF